MIRPLVRVAVWMLATWILTPILAGLGLVAAGILAPGRSPSGGLVGYALLQGATFGTLVGTVTVLLTLPVGVIWTVLTIRVPVLERAPAFAAATGAWAAVVAAILFQVLDLGSWSTGYLSLWLLIWTSVAFPRLLSSVLGRAVP